MQKLKSLELSDEIHNQVYNLLYTSDSESDSTSENDFELPNSDSEQDPNNKCNDCDNDLCNCDEMMYKLQAQFEDLDLDVKTLTAENILELLKEVSDEKLREKILNLATQKSSTSSSTSRDNTFENQPMSYSLAEVNRRLALSKTPGRNTTFDDLKIEVEKLKREIISLQQNQMVTDHRLLKIEETINFSTSSSKGKEKDFENSEDTLHLENYNTENSKNDSFLGMMQIVSSHKWYINCTILINKNFFITNVAMIDSGADVSCIQEGLIPTKYFEKNYSCY